MYCPLWGSGRFPDKFQGGVRPQYISLKGKRLGPDGRPQGSQPRIPTTPAPTLHETARRATFSLSEMDCPQGVSRHVVMPLAGIRWVFGDVARGVTTFLSHMQVDSPQEGTFLVGN